MTLKQRYAEKWRVGAWRELLVYNILNILLDPYGFTVVFTGIGSGSADFIDKSYDNPVNAFDFVVLAPDGRLAGFIDVTGYRDYSSGKTDTKPCILLPKIWKAERFSVLDRLWFIHVVDSRISLRFIRALYVKHLLDHGMAEKRRLYSDENWYVCIPQEKWAEPRRFIESLLRWLKR